MQVKKIGTSELMSDGNQRLKGNINPTIISDPSATS